MSLGKGEYKSSWYVSDNIGKGILNHFLTSINKEIQLTKMRLYEAKVFWNGLSLN